MIELPAVGAVVVLFLGALALVRRDYRAGGTLAPLTVALVWAAYVSTRA